MKSNRIKLKFNSNSSLYLLLDQINANYPHQTKFEEDCHKIGDFAFAEENFNFNGKEVHIYRTNTKHDEGLIFVHGVDSPVWMYAKLLQKLSERFETIALDLPGFDRSEEVGEQLLKQSAQT